jgi:histidine ammonia-lyase
MIAQYTAASLVSENKVLSHPASVDTIPTSGNQEDHVSMGWTSMRKLHDVLANVRSVLAVEIITAAQGIDFRMSIATPAPAVAAVHRRLRETVETMVTDRSIGDQIDAAAACLPELVAAAESASGPLA